MPYSKEISIHKMFKECGLMLKGNDPSYKSYLLPKKINLKKAAEPRLEYDNYDEESKLNAIVKFLGNHNHFKITDWELFFNNPDIFNEDEKEMLELILKSFRIYYENNDLRFSNYIPALKYVANLSKNKDFIKKISNEFPKDFQIKVIFMPIEQLKFRINSEIIKLIENKITELGFLKKINIELPKLIINDLK